MIRFIKSTGEIGMNSAINYMKRPAKPHSIVVNVLVLLVVPELLVGLVVHATNRQQDQRLDHIALPLDLRLREHHMVRFPAVCASFPSTALTPTPLHRLALRGFPTALQSGQRRGASEQSVRHAVGVPERVADRREIHAQQPAAALRRRLPRAGVGGRVVAPLSGGVDVQRARGSVIGEHRRHGGRRAGRFHRVEPVEARVLGV